MFALVDANAFYCSAEQVFRPEWRNRPIVVLSNNDGCIVAANRLAKQAGVKKFGAYFKQQKLCEQRGVIALSSNYELYADLSARMMNVISEFAPEQYVYSIDESFLSFEHCHSLFDFKQQAQLIRQAVWKRCRLPVSVGVAPTLTLAKLANNLAKQQQSLQGVYLIDSEQSRVDALKQATVNQVWGIGRRLSQKLEAQGIHSAFQLANSPPKQMGKQYSIEVERIVRELRGEACKHWEQQSFSQKQIYSTRSVGQRITQLDDLQAALAKHAATAAAKARKQGCLARYLVVFAGNSPFDDNHQRFHHQQSLNIASQDSLVLVKAATDAAKHLYRPSIGYYKIGVGLLELIPDSYQQQDLFEPDPAQPAVMGVMDQLNQRYGRNTLYIARQGSDPKWAMRRQRLTPRYTSCWRDIPKIKC